MQEKGAVRQLYESIPVQAVKDGCVISRYADVTFGWEVTLPSLYSVMEDGYDDMVELFASAARILPPWTVMHRQDVYRMEEYHPEIREDEFIMRQWNKRHFDGRADGEHRHEGHARREASRARLYAARP